MMPFQPLAQEVREFEFQQENMTLQQLFKAVGAGVAMAMADGQVVCLKANEFRQCQLDFRVAQTAFESAEHAASLAIIDHPGGEWEKGARLRYTRAMLLYGLAFVQHAPPDPPFGPGIASTPQE